MTKILGLARRARKIIIGTELTVKGIRSNRIKLVLLATDASSNTKKQIYDKSNTYKVEVIESLSSDELSLSIGKKNIKVLGIVDEGFSKLLLNQVKEVNNYGQKATNEESSQKTN